MTKVLFDKIDLPPEWKMKFAKDIPARNVKLTPQERNWLECHDHFHGYREILAVISGQALLRLDGRLVRITRGEFLAIDPWVRHTSGHLPDESAVFWWCILDPGYFRCLFWRRNRIDSYQIMRSEEEFVRMLNQTFSEKKAEPVAAELQHFIAALICRFIRKMPEHDPYSQGSLHQETAVEKVLAWLENLPVLKCSVNEASSLAGYSRPHFQRLFRQYTGRSFHDYLQVRRVEKLHALRSLGNIAKKEIAAQLGFASTAALNHWEHGIH